MNPEPFDPEDFLDLRPAAPGAPAAPKAALPPIVAPPIYQRSRSAPTSHVAPLAALARAVAAPSAQPAPVAAPSPAPVMLEPVVAPPVYPRRGEAVPRLTTSPVIQTRRAAAQDHEPPAYVAPDYAAPAYAAPDCAAPAYAAPDCAAPEYAAPEYAEHDNVAPFRVSEVVRAPHAPEEPLPLQDPAPQYPAAPEGHGWLSVICEGIELRLRAWNASGFTLETPLFLDEETLRALVFDVTLLIGRGATRLEMHTRARADADSTPQAERFVFVDLESDQAEILHRAVALGLARKPVSVMQLLGSAGAPQAMPAPPVVFASLPAAAAESDWPPAAAPQPQSPRANPPRKRSYRPSLRALVVLAALAVVGGYAWNNASSLPARYGAVTVSATSLAAPAAGNIDWLPLEPGQPVATGEILGHLRPASLDLSPLIAQLLESANDPSAPLNAPLNAPGMGDPRGTPILSPCDCLLYALEQPNGDWAEAGEVLATFAGREAPMIQVLVRAEEAGAMAPGNRALIDLADGTALQGRVTRRLDEAQATGTLGFQADVFGLTNYTRVEIRPDSPLAAPAGTAAGVTIQTSAPWGWLRARTHALWGEIRALAGL